LILHLKVDEAPLDFQVKKILNAGYTARDQSQVRKHIEELKKEGVPTPKTIPVFFPKLADRITTADEIEVLLSDTTSGEVEFALLFNRDEIYVGVGSDHTDRKLEQYSIIVAKQMCPNIISNEVWRYEDLKDHWDSLIMRSWVENNGQRELYQEANLGTFLDVDDLISRVEELVNGDTDGLVFYAGTIPVLSGEMCFSLRFEAELADETTGKSLRCAYNVKPVSWFKGDMQPD